MTKKLILLSTYFLFSIPLIIFRIYSNYIGGNSYSIEENPIIYFLFKAIPSIWFSAFKISIVLNNNLLHFDFLNILTFFEVLNLSIYILLFIGIYKYYNSGGKKVKYLQFFISILIINNTVFIINDLTYNIKNLLVDNALVTDYILDLIIILINIIIMSYIVIKFKKSLKKNCITSIETPKRQRFFHYITDIILTVLTMSIIDDLFFTVLGNWSDFYARFLITFLLERFLYTLFFEYLFQVTPGKILTKSQVVSVNHPLKFSTIFLRNLCRLIPFESLSILNKLWHDEWTKTKVVKVNRN